MVPGQARKSLWIETISREFTNANIPVRLVRACGSKHKRKEWYIVAKRSGS